MNKEQAIKLITYLVTSARGCVDEPKIYGSFRLVDSATRLFDTLRESGAIEDGSELAEVVEKINEYKYTCMTDEKQFVAMLDEVVDKLVDIET